MALCLMLLRPVRMRGLGGCFLVMVGFVIVMVMMFARLYVDVRMMVTRMTVANCRPALRRGIGINQQQFGGPQGAKRRTPSNDSFAQYFHAVEWPTRSECSPQLSSATSVKVKFAKVHTTGELIAETMPSEPRMRGTCNRVRFSYERIDDDE